MTTKPSVSTQDDKKSVNVPTAYKDMSKAELLKLAQSQLETIAKQQSVLATAKVTKITSEYFCNSKNDAIAYKNLSETKRHFENAHADILKAECELLNVKFLTSKAFHTLLSSKF